MELTHPELELLSSVVRAKRGPAQLPGATLAQVLRELRTGAAGKGVDKRRLVEVLSSEDKLLRIKTTDINNLLRKARVSEEQWRAIKTAKRKIRKKVNKRASDGRSKREQVECETELGAALRERQGLLAEIASLERECEFYLVSMDRLQREWHSI